jgi:carbohydrate-binding DOMON domain-containing protein
VNLINRNLRLIHLQNRKVKSTTHTTTTMTNTNTTTTTSSTNEEKPRTTSLWVLYVYNYYDSFAMNLKPIFFF